MSGMPYGVEFLNSDNGQIIAGAHKYLSAARLLRETHEFHTRPSLLMTPTLHLVAHGIELLLKFPLLDAGMTLAEVRGSYGHELLKLWEDGGNAAVRGVVFEAAEEAWAVAFGSGGWPDDFNKDPKVEVVEHLAVLAMLHSKVSDFALRYVVPSGTMAPRPAFMIDAFGSAAERVMKSPNLVRQ